MKHINHPDLVEIRYPTGHSISNSLERIDILSHLIADNLPKNTKAILLCRGSSGAIIASLVARHLTEQGFDCLIEVVRKKNEFSHHSHVSARLEPNIKHIIVDDFIVSGETVNHIYKEMRRVFKRFDTVFVVDILAVTAKVDQMKLDFEPELVISQRYEKDS